MTTEKVGTGRYRVVILSSLPPRAVSKLASRIARDVPGCEVAGVLYETASVQSLPGRITSFVSNLRRPAFWPYVGARVGSAVAAPVRQFGHALLRVMHASPRHPNGRVDEGLGMLAQDIERLGGRVFVSRDIHSTEALEFVRGLNPSLGIVYGTRILKPQLFEIPRHGSINVHKRKVPDYRGGGPIGLWELLDDQSEIGVTVHRVAAKLDAGNVIRSAVIPIEPFDTLKSLELKANVVGLDLIVQATTDFARGTVSEFPQPSGGRMFRSPAPEQLRRYRRTLAHKRRRFTPRRTRPLWKLLARVLVLGPQAIVRNWSSRRHSSFPVVVLYHHVITDQPHTMGLSTEQFFNQMAFLAKHYRILSLPEAIERLRSGKIDAPTVVLTFDDGYSDNVLTVRAVAEEVDMSATFFICSEGVSTQRPFLHDLQAGDLGFSPMTWRQVRELRREGFDFGSHTRTHFDCGSHDEAVLKQEIVQSRREIEGELGEPVHSFSFPWGLPKNMSEMAVRVASENYDVILSACNGVNFPTRTGPRVHLVRCVHPETVLELELTLQSLLELDPEGPRLPF